ncbi:hypothetical protein IP85_10320 [Rhizobium sp. AAP116]|nr:hypothetical protein IP85_10320 [Rhizobium sp. AAP116]
MGSITFVTDLQREEVRAYRHQKRLAGCWRLGIDVTWFRRGAAIYPMFAKIRDRYRARGYDVAGLE